MTMTLPQDSRSLCKKTVFVLAIAALLAAATATPAAATATPAKASQSEPGDVQQPSEPDPAEGSTYRTR